MKITKITFEQLFPTGQYANQRLGIEIDVSECSPSTIVEHYQYAMDKVNSAFKALNPEFQALSGQSLTDFNFGMSHMPLNTSHPDAPGYEPTAVEAIISDIMECAVIDDKNQFGVQTGLLSYEHMTNDDPRIKEAYDKRLSELSK